jgi:hypothetical protein
VIEAEIFRRSDGNFCKKGKKRAFVHYSIPLEKLFAARQIAPTAYKVQKPNGKFEGELQIGLKFFPKVIHNNLVNNP